MPHTGPGLSSRALGRGVSDTADRHHAWCQEPEGEPGLGTESDGAEGARPEMQEWRTRRRGAGRGNAV